MENFEPLNASGTNDMVELWPSEISTLRISLWISPYGILPHHIPLLFDLRGDRIGVASLEGLLMHELESRREVDELQV